MIISHYYDTILPVSIPFRFTQFRLEDEDNQNQKLVSERASADSKIKSLEEQMTLSEDNISKVSGLVKNVNSVSPTTREKDLYKSSIVTTVLTKQTKIGKKSSNDCKIFSLNCATDNIDTLGFKNSKSVSDKFPFTDFIKCLAVEDCLGAAGSLRWSKSHEIFTRNDLVKYLVPFVSRDTANITQNISKCKKQYDICAQKLVEDKFIVFDAKTANVKSNIFLSTFNLNLNNRKNKPNLYSYSPNILYM